MIDLEVNAEPNAEQLIEAVQDYLCVWQVRVGIRVCGRDTCVCVAGT